MFRGSDALVSSLIAGGVTHVFALSGNHIMPVFDSLVDWQHKIQLVHVRHEASTVHMADAFARVSGKVGIALVTGGPGHANALPALYTALMADSPVVLLSGHAPTHLLGQGAFQEMPQADMASHVCKASWMCARSDDVAADIAKAIRLALSGRPGPVHVSLPFDVLEQPAERPAIAPCEYFPTVVELEETDSHSIVQMLFSAQRPLVLVGPALLANDGRALLDAFQLRTSIPTIGMESPRGVADASLGKLSHVLSSSDVVLLLGKRVDFTLRHGQALSTTAVVVQIDADAGVRALSERAFGPRLAQFVCASPNVALQRLLTDAPRREETAWSKEANDLLSFRPPSWAAISSAQGNDSPMHPLEMMQAVKEALDADSNAVLVCDGGEVGQWAVARLQARHRVINGPAGAIGVALPFAIGASFAAGGARVIAVSGDGAAGFSIMEMDTAVRCKLPVLLVIGNDAKWNAEHQIQLREYGPQRTFGCQLLPTRYGDVAVALGADGVNVEQASELPDAVRRGVSCVGPFCLNVMINSVCAPSYLT